MEQESIDQVVNSKQVSQENSEEVDENQAMLAETVSYLNEVNQKEYNKRKTFVNQVKSRERKGRQLLREETQLPDESGDYSALEEIRPHGNVVWKRVAYALKKRKKVSQKVFDEVREKSRGNAPCRLVYGRKGDGNYHTAKQMLLFTEGKAEGK